MKKLIVGFLLFTLTTYSQITSATLIGKIEVQGNVKSRIELKLIDKSTNYYYITDVNKKGDFEFTDLQVGGPYELEISIGDKKIIKKISYLKLGDNEISKIIITMSY